MDQINLFKSYVDRKGNEGFTITDDGNTFQIMEGSLKFLKNEDDGGNMRPNIVKIMTTFHIALGQEIYILDESLKMAKLPINLMECDNKDGFIVYEIIYSIDNKEILLGKLFTYDYVVIGVKFNTAISALSAGNSNAEANRIEGLDKVSYSPNLIDVNESRKTAIKNAVGSVRQNMQQVIDKESSNIPMGKVMESFNTEVDKLIKAAIGSIDEIASYVDNMELISGIRRKYSDEIARVFEEILCDVLTDKRYKAGGADKYGHNNFGVVIKKNVLDIMREQFESTINPKIEEIIHKVTGLGITQDITIKHTSANNDNLNYGSIYPIVEATINCTNKLNLCCIYSFFIKTVHEETSTNTSDELDILNEIKQHDLREAFFNRLNENKKMIRNIIEELELGDLANLYMDYLVDSYFNTSKSELAVRLSGIWFNPTYAKVNIDKLSN